MNWKFLAANTTVKIVKNILSEQLCFVDEGRRYTQRYEEYIYHRFQVTTVSQVKREEELSWDQIQGIFNHQRAQVKKPHGERLNV
ncbi:transposase family protein [Microcoleus sp. F8-D3]